MNPVSSIIHVLIAYGTIQAIFIAIIISTSGNKTLFKKLFASLLIVEGIILFERLMVETGFINSAPHLLGIAYPISFLKPPLMLFMAYSLTIKGFQVQKKSFLHLIPFALIFLMNIPFYFMSGAEKLTTIQTFMSQIPSYQDFSFYFSLSFFFYIGIYIFFSVRQLNRFQEQVTNNALVNWYRLILLIYSGFLALHLVYFLIQPLGEFNFALINQGSMLAMTFIIQAVAFKLIAQSPFFVAQAPDLSDLEKRNSQEKLIIDLFEKEKVHLDDTLTLQSFAKAIDLPQKEVSQLVNQRFNYSFKKLVAQYRINEAKQLLKESDSSVKLIDIAFQAGFNNKVSFYRAFKEFEGVSPSKYLENLQVKKK